jgi:hypothetical protein
MRPSSEWSRWAIRFRFKVVYFSVAQAFTPGKANENSLRSLPQESVGKSRRDAMFIESSSPIDLESPFMGERRLVALLKELSRLKWDLLFYKHFTATRFFRQPPLGGFRSVVQGCGKAPSMGLRCRSFIFNPGVNAWATENLGYKEKARGATQLLS